MDPVQQAQTPPTAAPQPTVVVPQVPKKSSNTWMIIAIVLILVLLGVGIFILRKNSTKSPVAVVTPTITMTQSPSSQPTVMATQTLVSPTTMTSPTSSPTTARKVSAGMQTQSFTSYTITAAAGWTDTHQTDPITKIDKLVLSKNGSSLTISQATGGAGSCAFPGDTPQPMSQALTSPVGITGASTQFQRGVSTEGNYTVCESKTGGYVFPTTFGYITYILADPTDQSTLTAMDLMVASLTK